MEEFRQFFLICLPKVVCHISICSVCGSATGESKITLVSTFTYSLLISGEFCISSNPSVKTGASDSHFWDEKYSVREEQVLIFLQPAISHILTTGKYFHVVHDCAPRDQPHVRFNLGRDFKYHRIHQVSVVVPLIH